MSTASTSASIYPCNWASCRRVFSENSELVHHVVHDHVRTSILVRRRDIPGQELTMEQERTMSRMENFMATEIKVYAPLPLSNDPDSDRYIALENWRWVHCLTIPLEKLIALSLSHNPYKWIRFAIGVVLGAEGLLSTSSDFIQAVVDNQGSAELYYHISDDEKTRMFPIDPDIERTHITSSVHTHRIDAFREEVAERDGRRCIVTNRREEFCTAAHLLTRSKGDAYIDTYSRRRGHNAVDVVGDVDDIRNGVFVHGDVHIILGVDIAFLVTPNFAMDTNDVDSTALPSEKRYTSHLFTPYESDAFPPSGSRVRIADTPNSPPSILLDAVYASAVMHHFGTEHMVDNFRSIWKDDYYPGGVNTSAKADYRALTNERHQAVVTKLQHDRQHDEREDRRRPANFDLLMLPYILSPRDELHAMFRRADEKAEAAAKIRAQEKVGSWIQQLSLSGELSTPAVQKQHIEAIQAPFTPLESLF